MTISLCVSVLAAALAGEIPITTASPEAIPLFLRAREMVINFNQPAALALLRQTIEKDPSFALAHAYLGKVTPGEPGMKELEKASQLAASLSEPEKVLVEMLFAEKKGDDERARFLKRKLAEIAPGDWFAQFMMGVQSLYDHKTQAQIVYLKKAIALNPKAAEAYNYLGYGLAIQGSIEEGIASTKKFSELKPEESNAWDSLGELQLLGGRFGEAEQSFRRATGLSADDWMSWVGAGYARAFRGDYPGAREAFAKGKEPITRTPDRLALDVVTAWSFLCEDKGPEALRSLDAVEKEAQAKKLALPFAWAPLERAEVELAIGQYDLARDQAELALSRAATAKLSGDEENRLRRQALAVELAAGARSGKLAPAKSALAALEAELAKAPSNTNLHSLVQSGRGEVALARGAPAEAVQDFLRCTPSDYACRLRLADAQMKAGDASAAQETRKALSTVNARDYLHHLDDPVYLYVRSRVTPGQR